MPNRRKILAWIIFGTPFWGRWLNTGMIQDHSPPPSSTSTGFISLLFPPIQRPISSEFSFSAYCGDTIAASSGGKPIGTCCADC